MDAYSVVYLIVIFFLFSFNYTYKKTNGTVINKSKLKHSLVLSACESVPVFFICFFFINGPEQTELLLQREKKELTEGSYGPTSQDARIWHFPCLQEVPWTRRLQHLWTESAAQ